MENLICFGIKTVLRKLTNWLLRRKKLLVVRPTWRPSYKMALNAKWHKGLHKTFELHFKHTLYELRIAHPTNDCHIAASSVFYCYLPLQSQTFKHVISLGSDLTHCIQHSDIVMNARGSNDERVCTVCNFDNINVLRRNVCGVVTL